MKYEFIFIALLYIALVKCDQYHPKEDLHGSITTMHPEYTTISTSRRPPTRRAAANNQTFPPLLHGSMADSNGSNTTNLKNASSMVESHYFNIWFGLIPVFYLIFR